MTESLSEGVHGFMAKQSSIMKSIAIVEPIIREELLKMDEQTFWKSVCHNIIADTLESVKEGTHLFQCPWRNREVFDDLNSHRDYMIAKDPATPERIVEERAEIMVNIARLARFSMACPWAGTERCYLRNFRFGTPQAQEDHKRERI